MEYERVEAALIQPGDWIAAARTHKFNRVVALSQGEKSVYITFPNGSRIRPNYGTKFWRVTDWSVD